ncbi:hypothetical protein M0813_04844 [Anaeramoeba flamelloides]|uniref:Uncharacterized protein n=1 Tax=Anaeramoeba flamelloides TaxID=1746091 RepID=A0ABQ8XJQ3_9EUKA|nr:hypothetical protein M0813_04844 [Anaeramoeba flamelloides]
MKPFYYFLLILTFSLFIKSQKSFTANELEQQDLEDLKQQTETIENQDKNAITLQQREKVWTKLLIFLLCIAVFFIIGLVMMITNSTSNDEYKLSRFLALYQPEVLKKNKAD